MADIKSDNEIRRIENSVPEYLILKKSDKNDLSTRDITVYDLMAHFAGLSYVRQDIYVNKSGEEFIRTKYGFQSVVQYNQNLRILQLDELIEELQYKLKFAKEKIDRYGELIRALEAKIRERKENFKTMLRPFIAENDRLIQEINTVKKELKRTNIVVREFKQASEHIISKLTKLNNQTDDKAVVEESISTELDWSVYDDIFSDKELFNDKDLDLLK